MENVTSSESMLNYNFSNATFMKEYHELIEKLNHERMLFQLPVLVTLMVVMVVAIFGNILVISVYRITCKSSVASFFITLLAVVDLTMALCIPFNIQDMLNPYKNPVPIACKIGRFLETFVSTMSGNFLLCVAFDRYFHIIYPLRRYTFQQAKALAIVMTAIALCFSWPQLFLAGRKTVETPIEGIYGEDCSFRDEVDNSIYTLLFQAMLTIYFTLGMFVFIIFYGRIYYVIWRSHRRIIGEQVSYNDNANNCNNDLELKPRTKNKSTKNSKVSADMGAKTNDLISTEIQSKTREDKPPEAMICDKTDTMNKTDDLTTPSISRNGTDGHSREKKNQRTRSTRSRSGTANITRIMAIVTVFGFLGFLPYLLVNIFKNIGLFFQPDMSQTEDLIYEFCTKSHFLNSFVNPIIYSIMNPLFRSNAWKTLKKVGQICCLNNNTH